MYLKIFIYLFYLSVIMFCSIYVFIYLCICFKIVNIFMMTTLKISVRVCALMCVSLVIYIWLFFVAFAYKLCLIVMYKIVTKSTHSLTYICIGW